MIFLVLHPTNMASNDLDMLSYISTSLIGVQWALSPRSSKKARGSERHRVYSHLDRQSNERMMS